MIQPTNAQQAYPNKGGANAVNISIFNPQAYGDSTPQTNPMQTPNYTNSLYEMPQASMYGPQTAPQDAYYQQFIPSQNPQAAGYLPGYINQPNHPQLAGYLPQDANNVVQMEGYLPQDTNNVAQIPGYLPPLQNPQAAGYLPGYINQPLNPQEYQQPAVDPNQMATYGQPENYSEPMPQEQAQAMPESVIADNSANEVQPEAETQQSSTPQDATSQQTPTVNPQDLINQLQSNDVNQQQQAINAIAKEFNESPDTAQQIISEPLLQSLIGVVNQDTSNLEGPNEQQIQIAQKIANKEQLTPEEEEIAKQSSPRDAANENRMYALYDLALIGKLQKDSLQQYSDAQAANGQQPMNPAKKIEDIVGYNEMVNIIQNKDERPEVKVAAISALAHLADPQDVPTVQGILADSLNSDNEVVKKAAEEVNQNLIALSQQASNQQPQEVAQQAQETQAQAQEQPLDANQQPQAQEQPLDANQQQPEENQQQAQAA